MARRVIDAGIPTTLWATTVRDPRTVSRHAGSRRRLAGRARVEERHHRDLRVRRLGRRRGAARRHRRVRRHPTRSPSSIIHSTVRPDTVRRCADEAAARGVELLDAPVSGGGGAAASGRLLVMVGGASGDVRPVRSRAANLRRPGDPPRTGGVGPVGEAREQRVVRGAPQTRERRRRARTLVRSRPRAARRVRSRRAVGRASRSVCSSRWVVRSNRWPSASAT